MIFLRGNHPGILNIMHFYGHIILAYRIRKSPLVAVTEYEIQGPGTMEPSEVHRVYHRSSYKNAQRVTEAE
jgi:hypothetical protein